MDKLTLFGTPIRSRSTATEWSGKFPRYRAGKPVDDFGYDIGSEFIDGRTCYGPWGIMAPISFRAYGVGLGTGRGQRYRLSADNRWMKVEG